MYVVLGANGHVGSAVAECLLNAKASVTVVLRDAKRARAWSDKGAQVALADVMDAASLRRAFRKGERLFLLNPPAPPTTDTPVEERKSLHSILEAIRDSEWERIVAQSTIGAQPGERNGDLGVLYEMEQALLGMSMPVSLVRAAFYMSNWDAALQPAHQSGRLPTFYPSDFELPMIAPRDLGAQVAELLTRLSAFRGSLSVEGPARYTSRDVADAFARALDQPVEAAPIPRERWPSALKEMGFGERAADAFACMLAQTTETAFPAATETKKGTTTLHSYIHARVARQNIA